MQKAIRQVKWQRVDTSGVGIVTRKETKRGQPQDLSAGALTFSLHCLSCIISCLSEFLQCSASGK